MIEAEHLSKLYGSTPALRDVTFSVKAGEILGFLGPNGAGKTTTMRILTGYLPATSGTARIAGFEVHEQSMSVRKRIGYLPETPPLYPDMSVEGFLHFVAQIKGVVAGDRRQKVDLALHRCNLTEKRQVLIRKLSKGFRQRVGIAQAIVHDPPVIILDEPTVGLDPRQIIDVRNLIKSLAGSHTVILSTHILPEASMICNRVAIINRGEVITPEQLNVELNSAGYELEIEGNLALAQDKLTTIAGIQAIESLPDELLPETHHKLKISSLPGVDVGRDVAQAIVQSGLGLHELRRIKLSLEDVFLRVTTEEAPIESLQSESSDREPDDREASEQAPLEPNLTETSLTETSLIDPAAPAPETAETDRASEPPQNSSGDLK